MEGTAGSLSSMPAYVRSPVSAQISRFINQDIDLTQGGFVNRLLRARLIYSYSPQLALIGLLQWNSNTGEVNINVRLNFIHRPGSDLFLVFNETSPDRTGVKRSERPVHCS